MPPNCTILYIIEEAIMKLSISEVRKQLPALVRQVQHDAGASVQITVHDEVVAELRAVQPEPEPGAAAKTLHQFMKRLPKPRGRKTQVSSHVKAHLYGNGSAAS
jgi:antitoxin (DNA-binding transcriptional repressor) of toxin-antitoxin stability system